MVVGCQSKSFRTRIENKGMQHVLHYRCMQEKKEMLAMQQAVKLLDSLQHLL